MNAPCSGAPLTAPHVTTGGLCRWKAINKVGRHVGLDFYDLLIEAITPTDELLALRDLSTDPVVTCVAEVWIYGDAPFLK